MGCRYTVDDWKAVRRELGKGATIRAAAAATGVDRSAVFRWSKMHEPPEWMWLRMEITGEPSLKPRPSPRARPGYERRVVIFLMHNDGRTHAEIADAIGCHRTTVSRELARASGTEYDPKRASMQADRLARRPKGRKPGRNPELRAYVVNALTMRWSPEQIASRIREEFPDDEGMRVSHETIYQAPCLQGKGELRHELGVELSLRSKRRGRRPQSRLPRRASRPWVEGRDISLRPPEAADRAVPGHWEGDLVLGSDMSSCLITLVERRSRFLLMSRLLVHDADTVEERLEKMVASIPGELSRTLTWDQGSEMAKAARFELATSFKVYFCEPRSPWQRPTNENVNGLVREFFPKGTKFTEVTDDEVAEAQWLLNNRPRKVLGWKFPSEVMQEVLAEGAMIA